MANRNFFETLTQYRLKVEKDGKPVVNVPSILALPGLLMAPKLSIAGLVAAPLLGLKVQLENESGEAVDVEGAVRKAAETVRESVTTAGKSIKEEIDKAWEAVSADDPEETDEEDAAEETADDAEEDTESSEANAPSNEELVEELKKHEEDDIPTIDVKPEDSAKA